MADVMTTVSTNVTALIGVAKSTLGLLAEFPINLIVATMVAGIGFKFIHKAKKIAH